MNTKQQTSTPPASGSSTGGQTQPQGSGTRDKTGLYWSTSIKITDPQNGQVLLHTRGD